MSVAVDAAALRGKCEAVKLADGRVTNVPCAAPTPGCAFVVSLLCSTGERNGFTVLTEAEFYDFHLTTPGLNVMLIRVRTQNSAAWIARVVWCER